LGALVARANEGDQAALADLRRFLDAHPEVWQVCGDLGKHAERAWLGLISGEVLGTESIRRHVEQLRADLAGPRPTAMEQLLVNQAVTCYLAVQHAEIAAARPGSSSVQQLGVMKRCESAQRRYLGALRALAYTRAALPQGLVPVNPLRLYGGEQEERTPA
jgi:hypothetical protein